MHKILRTAAAAVALTLVSIHFADAQQPAPTTRIRGQIEAVDGDILKIKGRDGSPFTVKLADNPRVMAMVKASLSDIKPGSYIGVTAMPQPDGSQKAIGIHIFLESQRGTAEGFRPWDRQPGSTMTNAAVDSMVAGVDGQVVMVKYKDGEKKVIVPPETPIVAYTPGNKDDIKPGAQVIIIAATKQPDGTFVAPGINVGRGVAPPM
jgi:hypothetical protein